ncbi:hypothetical protein AY599_13355 [Leptolyngbya valderiana BDU 20041]|nr:hypothetical protein AY599_13355 [Leptolyngbya valderiana BDU 20041]
MPKAGAACLAHEAPAFETSARVTPTYAGLRSGMGDGGMSVGIRWGRVPALDIEPSIPLAPIE